jgi:hypothetical protein
MPPMRKRGLGEREREREREKARRATGRVAKGRGVDTTPRSRYSGEVREERETTLPPSSYLHITLPLLCDVAYQQVGTVVAEHQLKCPR